MCVCVQEAVVRDTETRTMRLEANKARVCKLVSAVPRACLRGRSVMRVAWWFMLLSVLRVCVCVCVCA
ncbi:MAG: hypothetical protein P4L40_07495 [Terracidiphilus sp.]|nr:hypothetical protein [Terracidiphilus sp.]